jgi:hypothetical protein
MPITFYAQLGATVMDEVVATSGQIGGSDSSSSDIQEYPYDAVAASSKISEVNFNDATETMTFYRDVLAGVSENPFGSAYTAVGGLVADNVTRLNTTSDANNVTSVSLRTFVDETKTVINSVVTIATSDDLSNITASNIYDIAKSLQNNKFADELLGGLISDAADAWSNGGSFLGYPREILGESEIVDSICNALKDKSNASDALLAVGHVVSVAQVMNIGGIGGDEEQDSTEVMKNLMDNLSDDSIDIVSSVVSGTLKSSLGNNLGEPGTEEYETRMDKVSELVNDMLKELQKVQKTDDQEKIDREAAAVATVFDTVKSINTLEEEDAKAAVKAVKDSEVLKNTLKKFVDDNPNPLDTKFDNEEQKASAKETVTEALASMEISPSNELYDIILSLFGLKD